MVLGQNDVQKLQSLNKNRFTMKDWEASPRPFENYWPGVYKAVNTFLRGEYQAPWPPPSIAYPENCIRGSPLLLHSE